MIGFQTIGNATIIAYDKKPIISSDPWLNYDEAYFGSWSLNYNIPDNLKKDIFESEFLWFSHGHPDHADRASYVHFEGSTLLIPEHYGDRIFNYFNEHFDCIKLISNKW